MSEAMKETVIERSQGTNSLIILRDNICICGRMNAGKSTLMNLITGQETSIVDDTPGTTADVKVSLMEIHDFGPVKLFDTAGLDETNVLGRKKQEKTLIALKESDLIILMLPSHIGAADDLLVERRVLRLAEEYGKQLFVFVNVFPGASREEALRLKERLLGGRDIPSMTLDMRSPGERARIIDFLIKHYNRDDKSVDLLPFLGTGSFVALNIPVDEETPAGRLLRPQNIVLDYLLRHFIPFAGYRMNLSHGRSENARLRESEKRNYHRFLEELNGESVGVQLVITDSQAIDLVDPWTPPDIPVTTFSIIMAHQQSGGNLGTLVDGLRAARELREHDRVLIAELCNHDRKAEDIGTKQLPRLLQRRFGNLEIDFAEGRVFPSEDELKRYSLVIQCGGCMVDQQKYRARISDCSRNGVPVTNYGLIMSWLNSPDTFDRVMKPWETAGY